MRPPRLIMLGFCFLSGGKSKVSLNVFQESNFAHFFLVIFQVSSCLAAHFALSYDLNEKKNQGYVALNAVSRSATRGADH